MGILAGLTRYKTANNNDKQGLAMALDDIKQKIKDKIHMAPGLNGRFKFDFEDEGIIFVDATQQPPEISEEDGEADVILKCSKDTFAGFMDGSQDPTMAFMTGKLKVKGAMGLAMKLNAVLED
jgi:putative sterol carrier protein